MNASGQRSGITTYLAVLLAIAGSFWLSGWQPRDVADFAFLNLWLDADIPRVLENLTVREYGHSVTFKHPIASILLYPPVAIIRALGAEPLLAARILMAINAGLFFWLFDIALRRVRLDWTDRAAIIALSFGASGFVIWFGIIETFPIGGTSLLLGLLLADSAIQAPTSRARRRYWALATFVTMSITLTNVMLAGAAGLVALWHQKRREWWQDCVPGIALGLAMVTIMAIAQRFLFGGASLFFNPFPILAEMRFVTGAGAETLTISERLQSIYLQLLVMGEPIYTLRPALWEHGSETAFHVTDGHWPPDIIGQLAMAVWAVVLAISSWFLWQRRAQMPVMIQITLVFLFGNTVLHLLYGTSVYLYAAHFLGLVMLAVGWALLADPSRLRLAPFVRGALVLLAAAAFASNLTQYVKLWDDVQIRFEERLSDQA